MARNYHTLITTKQVDKTWRGIIEAAQESLMALEVFKTPNMLENLNQAEQYLGEVQKGLADYLETKRLYFPR